MRIAVFIGWGHPFAVSKSLKEQSILHSWPLCDGCSPHPVKLSEWPNDCSSEKSPRFSRFSLLFDVLTQSMIFCTYNCSHIRQGNCFKHLCFCCTIIQGLKISSCLKLYTLLHCDCPLCCRLICVVALIREMYQQA